jgi:hypothetical protein
LLDPGTALFLFLLHQEMEHVYELTGAQIYVVFSSTPADKFFLVALFLSLTEVQSKA